MTNKHKYHLLDVSSASPDGQYNSADTARPPSPLKLRPPVPAKVVMINNVFGLKLG
jgi:hypothetical protein